MWLVLLKDAFKGAIIWSLQLSFSVLWVMWSGQGPCIGNLIVTAWEHQNIGTWQLHVLVIVNANNTILIYVLCRFQHRIYTLVFGISVREECLRDYAIRCFEQVHMYMYVRPDVPDINHTIHVHV